MSQVDIKSKYIEFINEALYTENAAIDKITSRIDLACWESPACKNCSSNILYLDAIFGTNF